MTKTCAFGGLTTLLLSCAIGGTTALGQSRTVQPVLAFPEQGLDDPAAYQGYQTHFYRDSKQNTVQVYLEPRGSRVRGCAGRKHVADRRSVGHSAETGAGGLTPGFPL